MASKLLTMYVNSIAHWFSNGAFVNKSGLSSLGIRAMYDRIITKSNVKRVMCVSHIDNDLSHNFTSAITRHVCENFPDCSVMFTFSSFRSDLHRSIRTRDFKRNMELAYNRFSNYEEGFSQLSDSEQTVGKKVYVNGSRITVTKEQLDFLRNVYDSYKYSYDVVTNDGVMTNTYMFVELVAPDNPKMKKLVESFDFLMMSLKCNYMEVRKANNHYLSTMSPTGFYHQSQKSSMFASNLFSGENLSYLMPYKSSGFIGDGTGTLLGLDMGSRSPLILNFYKTSDRQIICYLVPSGEGKTMSSQMICLFMIHQKYHASVIDVKGDEWNKLDKWVKTKVIDISPVKGCFVNTIRLDDIIDYIDGNKEDARMFFSSAVSSTIEAIRIMSGYTEESKDFDDASSIIKYTVDRFFKKNNVNPNNYKTFKNTAGLDYRDVISLMGELKALDLYASKSSLIDNIQGRCISFLDTSGLLNADEISVADIIDTELIVYSLNRNRDPVGDKTLEALRTFMITYLDMKKIYIRKAKGLATVCFYEELQRKKEFTRLLTFINAVVTGARSSNVTVFLLCNTPKVLLDDDVSGVMSNISTFIIGKLKSEGDREVLTKLGVGDALPYVDRLTKEPNKFKHCFVCRYDTGYDSNTVIFKSLVPPPVVKYLDTRDRQES